MSKTTCPVFRPTLEEFRNFSAYIDKIDSKIGDAGLCKVIPPEGWYTPPSDAELEKLWEEKKLLVPPIKQCISGLRGVYSLGLMDSKKLSVKDFRAMARKSEPKEETSYEERERLFWRSMGPLAPAPLYGADMSGTLFQDGASGWNLAELDNMIKLLPSNLPGITTAMLYFGMWRAMFAFHTEDMNLYSINYLHAGRPKSWYSIPPHAAKRFESLAQSLNPEGFRHCSEFLRHKTSIFSPKVLRESGIPFHTLVQEPGEFVITFPASYHAGFNHGFNVAEATNFTTERWVDKGREAKVCRCQPYSVHIDVDDFVAKLEAKRAADRATVEALPTKTSKHDRKRTLKKLTNTGFLEWHRREEEERKEDEARAHKERQQRTQMRRKMTGYDPAVGEKRAHPGGPDDHTTGGSEEETETSLEEDGSNGDHGGMEEDLTEEESWEFKCRCGVTCSSEAAVEDWPKGAMFQCTGCELWSHTRCLYSKDQAPRLAFCADCYQTLKGLDESTALLHTGREIKQRSRVVVCRAPRGLEEGTVTMFGEGMARVYFKRVKPAKKKRKGGRKAAGAAAAAAAAAAEAAALTAEAEKAQKELAAPAEEWIPVMSSRFLSRGKIEAALALFNFQSPEARAAMVAAEARKVARLERQQKKEQKRAALHARHHSSALPVPSSSVHHAVTMAGHSSVAGGGYPSSLMMRGVPLPNAAAAVDHARFMVNLYRSKKGFRGLFSRTQKQESAPGGFYRRYHAPNPTGSVFDQDWTSDEEGGGMDEDEERVVVMKKDDAPVATAPATAAAATTWPRHPYNYCYPPSASSAYASASASASASAYAYHYHQQQLQYQQQYATYAAAAAAAASTTATTQGGAMAAAAQGAAGASGLDGWKYRVQIAPANLNMPSADIQQDIRAMSLPKKKKAPKKQKQEDASPQVPAAPSPPAYVKASQAVAATFQAAPRVLVPDETGNRHSASS